MEFDYVWQGMGISVIVILVLYVGFFVFSRFYSRSKRVSLKRRSQVKAYGFFALALAIMLTVITVAQGVRIYNPNAMLVALMATLTMALIYFDGRMTEKAVGGEFAVEANPLMALLFRWFGIRKVRIGVFIFALIMLAYLFVVKDLLTVSVIFLLWVFVDINNMAVLGELKREWKLRSSLINDELGVEDIHEL